MKVPFSTYFTTKINTKCTALLFFYLISTNIFFLLEKHIKLFKKKLQNIVFCAQITKTIPKINDATKQVILAVVEKNYSFY